MSSSILAAYGSSTAITCSMASKTTGQGERSAAIDNTAASTNFRDAWIFVGLKPGTLGTAPNYFTVYGYVGDGTDYDTGGSTDAAYNTVVGDENVIGTCTVTASTTFRGKWFLWSKAMGIYLPPRWGIIVVQTALGTLSATETDHIKKYVGVYDTVG